MRLLILTVMVAALVFVSAAAIPHPPRPWTITFRMGWNQACVDVITENLARQGQRPDPIKLQNFCDCSSDGLQQRYSEQEVLDQVEHPTAAFEQYEKEVSKSCLEGPI